MSSNTSSQGVPRIRKLPRLSRRELSFCGRGDCTDASQQLVRGGPPQAARHLLRTPRAHSTAVSKKHGTTTTIRQSLPLQQEHGVEVPAVRHQCRYFGTALLFESPPSSTAHRDVPT